MTDEQRALRDEITLLRRSIDDARAEHARGELTDAGLAAIELRDTAKLDDATARLVGAEPRSVTGDDAATGSKAARVAPRRPRWLLAAAAACVVLAVAVAVVAAATPFSPPTGPITGAARVQVLLVAAELEVARAAQSRGHAQQGHAMRALTLYDAILRLDPTDPEALAESGWLRYEAGLGARDAAEVAAAEAQLRHAVALAPREAAGHLYYGIVLLQHDANRRAALAQLWRAAALPENGVEESLTAQFIALAQHQ